MADIVVVNVSRTVAPAPSQLQKIGAFISQGGTTLANGARQLLQDSDDIVSILQPAKANSTLAWSTGVVTVTTAAPHGIPNGQIVAGTIAGVTPSGYNGSYDFTSTGASTFTYPLVSSPGSETVPGTYRIGSAIELENMNRTFWAQGSQQPVYVLELGVNGDATNIGALTTYLAANPKTIYSLLCPASWGAASTMDDLANVYASDSSMQYFFLTLTTGNMATYSAIKSVIGTVPAAGAPSTEFTAAAIFWKSLNYKPSTTNKVTPLAYQFVNGVTAWDIPNNQTTLNNILAAGANYIETGAQGGISDKIIRNGTTMDGRPFTYWYSVDWAQINVKQALTAAIINGSNNPQNPLYYNQDGINRLQAVLADTVSQGVNFGLIFGAPLQLNLEPADFVTNLQNGDYAGLTPINAQPFLSYSADNPNDYASGIYNGFQFQMTPNRGFDSITVNMNVTDFITG